MSQPESLREAGASETSCDTCASSEAGHYCLLHTFPMKDADLLICDDYKCAPPYPTIPGAIHDPDHPVAKNARSCGICGAPADRFTTLFQCQANPNHIADLNTGKFEDMTYPRSLTTAPQTTVGRDSVEP